MPGINEGVNEFLQSESGRRQLANIWMTPMGGSPAWLADYIKSENAK